MTSKGLNRRDANILQESLQATLFVSQRPEGSFVPPFVRKQCEEVIRIMEQQGCAEDVEVIPWIERMLRQHRHLLVYTTSPQDR